MPPLLEVRDLKKYYVQKSSFGKITTVKALNGVSFLLREKKILGIIGESGCGKSTLAKTLMGIEKKTSGEIKISGRDRSLFSHLDFRKFLQIVFQDPYSSINPRKKAWQIVAEPLFINTSLTPKQCRERAQVVMKKVGLGPPTLDRFPHMYSGGQRQRIGLARALILRPKVLILDEPVSALDVSIQAQVLNLLLEIQEEFDLSYLFITHDLSVTKHMADDIMVMYLGKVVEYGSRDQIFNNPKHPYTQALLEATPKLSGGDHIVKSIEGELPSPLNPPPGCAFHKRCSFVMEKCKLESPHLAQWEGRECACFLNELSV